MLEQLIIYSLSIWFVFYLANHSDLFYPPRRWVYSKVGPFIGYLLQCALCCTFWISCALMTLKFISYKNWEFCMVSPVINMFVELSYRKLVKE